MHIQSFSIISNGLVLGGQNLSRRQTVFFLPVDPNDESHRDPEYIDFSVPGVSRDTCTKHGRDMKTRYFGSILILESRKDECSIKKDRKQFFKEHFQPIVFQKLRD